MYTALEEVLRLVPRMLGSSQQSIILALRESGASALHSDSHTDTQIYISKNNKSKSKNKKPIHPRQAIKSLTSLDFSHLIYDGEGIIHQHPLGLFLSAFHTRADALLR